MRDFDFLEPATVHEASHMLADLGDDCRAIAGGTALMLGVRQRMLTPTHLVSLARLPQLRGIEFDAKNGLRIGALSRHADVANSPLVQQHYPVLASMASRVANPQVRNQGTIGGNLCYADPSTDPPGCLMALGAQVVLGSSRGERVLSIEEFLVDYYVTALESDEIVTEIRVPPPVAGTDGVYSRFLRTPAEHRPLASVALVAQAPEPRFDVVSTRSRKLSSSPRSLAASLRSIAAWMNVHTVVSTRYQNATPRKYSTGWNEFE